MIYPDSIGPGGIEIRLKNLECVWIQGKLKMWGRWSSYSEMPEAVNMFKRLMASGRIDHDDISKALNQLRKSGCSTDELAVWMNESLRESTKSSLVFCTDSEGIMMNRVIGTEMLKYPGLLGVLKARYMGRGKSKRTIASDLNDTHPEWSFKTCQRRVDVWLSVAESILYLPMNDAFGHNPNRFSIDVTHK